MGGRPVRPSLYYNPRRLFRRHSGHTGFENYGAVLEALERALYQVASLTRSLHQWRDTETSYNYRAFVERYGTFLASIADNAQLLSTLDEDHLADQAGELCRLAERAQHFRRQVTEQAERDGPAPDTAAVHAVTLTGGRIATGPARCRLPRPRACRGRGTGCRFAPRTQLRAR